MRKLTHVEIVTRQKNRQEAPLLPFDIILNDLRSLHNVGAIFRTCDGIGINKLWLCGITGYPPNRQICKTAIGAEERVEWEYQSEILSVIKNLKKRKYQIVILEQTDSSCSYHLFRPTQPVCLIVGNEIGGISDEVIPLADASVEIDMRGIKNSLNVSVAFGIVAYHFKHQLRG